MPTTNDFGDFREEIESVFWLFDEVRSGNRLPVMEAEAVVHCLYGALRQDAQLELPNISADDDQLSASIQALNVSHTAMLAAEAMKLEPEAVRAVGLAGLLHDVGMVRVPAELLHKTEPLTPEERAVLMRHPAEGATIILEAEVAPDVAVVAAYEHHLKPDGTGYPRLRYARGSHAISRLIGVCAGYHALTSTRPFRGAWSPANAITILEAAAGRDYDTEMVAVVTSLVRNGADERPQGT